MRIREDDEVRMGMMSLAISANIEDRVRICEACGRELSPSDFGFYCSNQGCTEFDKEKLGYEG